MLRDSAGIAVVVLAAVVFPACTKDARQGSLCARTVPAATGPGDVANHFPLSAGSRWRYDVQETVGGVAPTTYVMDVEVVGTEAGGSRFSFVRSDGREPASETVYSKGPGGVTRLADSSADPALGGTYPHMLFGFPVQAGQSFEQYSCSGLVMEDLDGDGRSERLDARSVVTVVGPEAVWTPAGAVTAIKVDTNVTLTVRASGGYSATGVSRELEWYAPGVGLVQRRAELVVDGRLDSTQDVRITGWVADGSRGGIVASRDLATGLAPADSNTFMPGPPALSFDGAGHLLVSQVSGGAFGHDTLRAWVVAPDGTPGAPFEIVDRLGYGLRPAVAFNGTSHLVVSNIFDAYAVFAQRVTPAGALLDPSNGISISTTPVTKYAPAVASDGSGWMVGWAEFQIGLQLARVSGTGELLGQTLLRTGSTGDPSIAYGAGTYLVAWIEGDQVVAVRVAPDGTVRDAQPLVVSSAPGAKDVVRVASDGTRFLVVWAAAAGGSSGSGYTMFDIHAARVLPDGAVLDGDPSLGGIVVNAFPTESKVYPHVAAAGGVFVVAWSIESYTADAGIHVARVTGDGVVIDVPVDGPGLHVAHATEYGAILAHAVVAPAAAGDAVVAWLNNAELGGTTKSVEAAWLAPPRAR